MIPADLIPVEEEAPVVATPDPTIPVDDGVVPPTLDPAVIKERAAKYDFALANNSPGLQALETEINAGREDDLRRISALENDSKIRQTRFNIIDSIAKQAAKEGREISPSERQTIMDLTSADFEAIRTDPNTFWEKEYAKRVLDKSNEIGDPIFDKVAETDEEFAFATEEKFVDVVARKEIFQKLADEENKRAKDQSWLGWGVDMATSLVPGVLWYNMNNALKGHKGTSILPGNNLLEQVEYLHTLPPEQAKIQAEQAITELRGFNQLMAQQFANAIVSYTSNSAFIDNLFIAGVDVATLGAGTALKTVRGIKNLGKAQKLVEAAPPEAGKVRFYFIGKPDPDAKAVSGTSDFTVAKNFSEQQKKDLYFIDVNEGSYPFLEPGFPADTVTRGATVTANIQGDFASGATPFMTKRERNARALLESMKKTAKAVTKPKAHPAEVADAMGDVDSAVALTVLDRVAEKLSGVPAQATRGFQEIMNEIPGFVNFDEIVGGVRSSLSAEAMRRMRNKLDGYTTEALQQLFLSPTAAARLTPESLRIAMQEQREIFRNLYRMPEDAILRVTTTEPGESGVDALYAKIHFGDNSGGLFESEEQAFNYARDVIGLRSGEFRTIPEGNNWFIEVARPLDETSPNVRASLRVDREGATDLGNTFGKAVASIRSGADTLPKDIYESLVNSAVGGAKLAKLLTDMSKDFLGVKDKKAFFDFLDRERRFHDGVDAIRVGKYSNTIPEFESSWRAMHGRLPTEQETQAYFTYRKMNDLHYVAMNLSRYTDKVRTGHANYKIDGISIPLEGKIVANGELPQGTPTDAGRILAINPSRYETPKNLSNLGSNALDELKTDIKNKNLVVVQLSPWGRQQARSLDELSDLGGKEGIDFIVMPRHWVREEQLSLKQTPYRPGGHIIYDENSTLISQPRMYRQFGEDGREKVLKYYGDTGIIVANKNVDPADFAKRWDTARKMLRDLKLAKTPGTPANKQGWEVLRTYVQQNLPITYKQFLHDFSKKGNLDLDLPILYSKMNNSLDEMWNLKDMVAPGENLEYFRESDSIYNTYAGQVNLKFAQEKGLLLGEVQNIGSKEVPMYGLRQTTLVDPMTALERSMQTIVRGRSFESAKWEAAEKFVAEFGGPDGVLKASDNELYRDPVMAMLHGEFRNDADPDLLRAANIFRQRVKQFFGEYKTPDQTAVAYTVDKMLSGIDKDSGKFFDKLAHNILSMKDPIQKFKAIAFHSTMGFFNIKQLLLNANTSTHIIGIAGPVIGSKSVAAALVNSIAMHGGKELDSVAAKMIEKLGFDQKEYLESLEAMRRSGWDQVGREFATREQHMNAQVLATTAGKYLDAGLLPFKKSEEFVRNAGWNAAYLEWRGRNPTKKLNDADIRSIVARADLLTVNMTQAANSSLQEGAAAFATQFWSYQMRMTEQFMGRRLSSKEKIKLWSTYSAVYGLPIGTAGVVGVWPVHESIRKYYLENNRDIDGTAVEKFVNDGVLSLLTEVMMGEKTNINQVYGPNGIPFFYELLFEDKTVFEAITGASGSVGARYMEDVWPVFPWIASLANPYEPTIQPKFEDFWDVVGNINSLFQAEKAYYAMNYGQLFDKYGQTIDPKFEGVKAFIYSLTGTMPDRVEDYYALYSLDVAERKTKIKQEKLIKEDIKKALSAKNVDEEMSYIRRAQTRAIGAGYDPAEASRIIVDTLKDNRSAIHNRMLDYKDRTFEEKEFLRQKYKSYGIKE